MATKRKRKKKTSTLGVWITVMAGIAVLVLSLILLLGKDKPQEPAPTEPAPTYQAEDFAWEDGKMVYLPGGGIAGIDVSYYQEEIDWQQVKQSGVDFAFIRVGYRSSTDGEMFEDELARTNLEGAIAAGVKVGAYFFSQALTPQEAVEEAAFAVSVVKHYQMDLPIAYDWEFVNEGSRVDNMTREALMKCVHAFCKTIEAAGYESMVYYNRDIAARLLDVEELSEYPVWFARYEVTHPDAPSKPTYWQYTDNGTVPGINTPVDLNLYLP